MRKKLIYLIVGFFILSMISPITAQITREESDKISEIERIVQKLETIIVEKIVNKLSLAVHGTEYQIFEEGTTFIQLLDSESQPQNTASCFMDAYFPNKTFFFDDTPLTYLADSDGLYFHDFTAPNTTGVYMLSSTCFNPANGFTDNFNDFSNIEAFANVTNVSGQIRLLDDTANICSGVANACSTFVSNVSCVAQQGCSFGPEASGGTINGLIDTFEFEPSNGMTPTSIKVNDSSEGSIYAVFYEGTQGDGFVSTYEIFNNGTINPTLIDTFEFDGTAGITPSALKISNDIYVVGYRGAGGDGFAETLNISVNGTIVGTLDNFEIDESDLRNPNLFWIDQANNLAGFSSSQTTTDGILGTGSVLGDGTINRLSRFIFNETQANFVDSINISSNVVLVAFQADIGGDNFGGHLQTINILNNGTANNTIDGEILDAVDGDQPSITHMNNDLYAITYKGVGGGGKISTYNVFTNGTISPRLNTFSYPGGGFFPNSIKISDEILGNVYQDGSGQGRFILVSIFNNGTITEILSNITFTAVVERPEILHFKDDIFIITYDGDGSDGFISTVNVTTTLGGDVCSGTATTCSLLNTSELICTDQLSCSFTPAQVFTTGFIQSTPQTLLGFTWLNFTSLFSDNDGTTSFSILDDSNLTLCSSLGDLVSCANTESPIKLRADISRPNASVISPTLDSWSVTWNVNGTIQEVRGSGELHVTDRFTSISSDVWNYGGTIAPNILNQFSSVIWEFADRTLTEFNFTISVSVEVNSTEIAESVWNFDGNISDNVVTTLGDYTSCVTESLLNLDDSWSLSFETCL